MLVNDSHSRSSAHSRSSGDVIWSDQVLDAHYDNVFFQPILIINYLLLMAD